MDDPPRLHTPLVNRINQSTVKAGGGSGARPLKFSDVEAIQLGFRQAVRQGVRLVARLRQHSHLQGLNQLDDCINKPRGHQTHTQMNY